MCISTLSLLPGPSWMTLFGGINIFITITATIENLLVLFLLRWYSNLNTLSNQILTSLAVSDFLVGVSIAPLHAIQLLDTSYTNHCGIDEARRYLSTLLIGASAFTIGFISYDRYVHLTKLSNYNQYMTRRKIYLILLLCWLIPGLLPMLRFIGDSESVYYASIITVLAIILGTLLFCYILIIYGLQKQRQRLHEIRALRATENHWRASRTVIILITCFVLMVMPISLHHMITIAMPGIDTTMRASLYITGQTLCMLNSAVNPVIYYFRNPHFKENCRKLIHFDLHRGVNRIHLMEESPRAEANHNVRRNTPENVVAYGLQNFHRIDVKAYNTALYNQ